MNGTLPPLPPPPTIRGQTIDGLYKGLYVGPAQVVATLYSDAAQLVKYGALKGMRFCKFIFNGPLEEEKIAELNNTIQGINIYDGWKKVLNEKLSITDNLIQKYSQKIENCDNPRQYQKLVQNLSDNLKLKKLIKNKIHQIDKEFTQSSIQELQRTNHLRNIISAFFFPFKHLPKTISILYSHVHKQDKPFQPTKKIEDNYKKTAPLMKFFGQKLDQNDLGTTESTQEELEQFLQEIGENNNDDDNHENFFQSSQEAKEDIANQQNHNENNDQSSEQEKNQNLTPAEELFEHKIEDANESTKSESTHEEKSAGQPNKDTENDQSPTTDQTSSTTEKIDASTDLIKEKSAETRSNDAKQE